LRLLCGRPTSARRWPIFSPSTYLPAWLRLGTRLGKEPSTSIVSGQPRRGSLISTSKDKTTNRSRMQSEPGTKGDRVMIDMKRDVKRPAQEVAAYPTQDEYPGGLCLFLSENEIKKLGIDLPSVTSEMTLKAKVKVVSVSDSDSIHGRNRSM